MSVYLKKLPAEYAGERNNRYLTSQLNSLKASSERIASGTTDRDIDGYRFRLLGGRDFCDYETAQLDVDFGAILAPPLCHSSQPEAARGSPFASPIR
jgi:hypothetical protein